MTLKTLRLALWGLAGVAALGFGGLSVWRSLQPPPAAQLADGLIAPSDQIGGPFSLVDGNGRTVTEADFKGKATAMFFGFTHCPDVCPTTLTEASQWLATLGADADKLRVVMVTVDPERDTPEVLRDYASAFDARISVLSGSPQAIAGIISAYKIYARKVPLADGDYTMDHTAGVYLMNRDMKFVGILSYKDDAAKAVSRLKALIGS